MRLKISKDTEGRPTRMFRISAGAKARRLLDRESKKEGGAPVSFVKKAIQSRCCRIAGGKHGEWCGSSLTKKLCPSDRRDK